MGIEKTRGIVLRFMLVIVFVFFCFYVVEIVSLVKAASFQYQCRELAKSAPRFEFTGTVSERELMRKFGRPINWGNPNIFYQENISVY